jgi:nucleolin
VKASPAAAKAKAPAKKEESSASSSSEEVKKPVKKTPTKEEKKAPTPPTKVEKAAPAKKEEKKTPAKKSESSSEGSSEEKPKAAPKIPAKAAAKKSASSSDSSDSSEEEKPKAKVNDKKRKAEEAAEEPEPKKAKVEGANTRVFLGNLPFTIDDDQIKTVFKDAGDIVDVHWVTDRQTGKFYGTGFVEFASAEGAQKAVAMAGQEVGGRAMKVDFAQPKGDRKDATPRGDKKFPAKGGDRAPTPKPDGCTTVFLGNLSFSIDEDAVRGFFKECGDISAIRWVERDGQFKGCGFVEFNESDSTDKAVAMSGQDLQGRAIRVDFSAPKAPREKKW